jgi:hypothetical protein
MRQPACVKNRWGTGTCSNQDANKTSASTQTKTSKEVNDKLAAMQAERRKQDNSFWTVPSASEEQKNTVNQTNTTNQTR